MRPKTLLITAIILLAAFLRLYRLGAVPASPDWDEVSLGYNAYSILKTGRDEYGTMLPLSIRSFGDYKPPLYTYLSVPSVAVFGLSVFAVRLPSALMGILAVAGTYLFVAELLRERLGRDKSGTVALIAAFLLAVSPWHLQFSRAAFEANTGVTLNIWGAYFFLRGLARNRNFPLSALCFGLALWAYHSERVFVPVLGLGLTLVYRDRLFRKENRSALVTASAVLGVSLVLIAVSLAGGGLSRMKGTSLYSNPTDLLKRSVAHALADRQSGDRLGTLFDNRRLVYVKSFADGYVSHFSLKWLFLTGDNARHHAPDMGLMYLVELPFFLYGVWLLAVSPDRGGKAAFWWLLAAPVAAAPTTGLPHAIRTLVFLPVIQLAVALGITGVWDAVSVFSRGHRGTLRVAAALTGIAFLYNVAYYFSMYYGTMDREYSEYWQYGYGQAVSYASANAGRYDRIVVSTSLEQPYAFFLFYLKTDPAAYLASGGSKPDGRVTVGKYEFRSIDWQHELRNGSVLYIGKPTEMEGAVGGTTVRLLNGAAAFRLADR